MTRYDVNDDYFEWMYQIACGDERRCRRTSYRRLLRYLHSVDFNYTIPMDGNRAEDGVDLRYRFGYERDYDRRIIATYLDDRSCSVLEMMVALVIRCEERLMDDPEIGNRTSQWFWSMIDNLGIGDLDDDCFRESRADRAINRFLNREYGRNGEGGLFTVSNPDFHLDMRSLDIWYQMCWYLRDFV